MCSLLNFHRGEENGSRDEDISYPPRSGSYGKRQMLLEFELSVCEQKSGDAHPSVVSNYLEEVVEREQLVWISEDSGLLVATVR